MSRALLDPQSADRLAKLCGMLGSAHDGERAAAAAKADELVRRLGLTWRDVISKPTPTEAAPEPMTAWRRMARYCQAYPHMLNARERDFIDNACAWHRDPTEKQASWLCSIYARLRARSSGS